MKERGTAQVPRSFALWLRCPLISLKSVPKGGRRSLSRQTPANKRRRTKQAVKYEFIRRGICAIWLSAPLHKWRAAVIYRALTRTTGEKCMPARQKRDNFEKGKKEVRGTAISRL